MPMPRRLTFVCILTLLVFAGCNKNTPQSHLPAATQTGAMTFGCVLNGNYAFSVHNAIVITGSGFGTSCSGGISGGFASGGLHMLAMNCPDQTYSVYVNIADSVVYPGTYYLGKGTANDITVVFQGIYGSSLDTTIRYECDQSHGGTITFTRASITDSIYSGTFSGTLTDGIKNYPLTDGRFDMKVD